MTRKEANLKIAEILKGMAISRRNELAHGLKTLALTYPDQRAGQLITNYITHDYRNDVVSDFTKEILEKLFPGIPDPFFEESVVTLKRIEGL